MIKVQVIVNFFKKNQDKLFFSLCMILACATGFTLGRLSLIEKRNIPSVSHESTKNDTFLEIEKVEDEYFYGKAPSESQIFLNKDIVQKGSKDEFKVEVREEDELKIIDKNGIARIILSGSAILGLACANDGNLTKEQDERLELSNESKESKISGNFVASKSSKLYHVQDCASAKRIKEENKIWFQTEKAAQDSGRSPHGCVK